MGKSPPLFGCSAIKKLRQIILSTSTLSSDIIVGGGFGPVNDDCYAVGYGIRSYGSQVQVMTYKGTADAAAFVECLEKAQVEMVEAAGAS